MRNLEEYTLNVADVASLLHYHPQHVRFLASSGKLPCIKRGRQWFFCEEELQAQIEEQTRKARGEQDDEDSASDLLQ